MEFGQEIHDTGSYCTKQWIISRKAIPFTLHVDVRGWQHSLAWQWYDQGPGNSKVW